MTVRQFYYNKCSLYSFISHRPLNFMSHILILDDLMNFNNYKLESLYKLILLFSLYMTFWHWKFWFPFLSSLIVLISSFYFKNIVILAQQYSRVKFWMPFFKPPNEKIWLCINFFFLCYKLNPILEFLMQTNYLIHRFIPFNCRSDE